MKTKLDIWRARIGKCLIVKCLGIAHLVYSASMLVIPNTYHPIIKNSVFSFIWVKKKQDKIKRDFIVMMAYVPPMLKTYLNHYI